ncbi:uncharacterized protein BXZ73DRAFT_106122 [Epithele typhae]|uniref:uncharacterized protein n=1 Tax=Epithele typhae TaxID=378194 RepID=UPI0020083B7A|nr:uncharacterized protein BXZ73DRAFT_106122 [Epithele typhae]KAH9915573.1 hypothetical protein BXZ73DRAFT_106122 [Epithele typhae]
MPLPEDSGLSSNSTRDAVRTRLTELQIQANAIAAEKLKLYSLWNSSLPINRLPHELLVLIFSAFSCEATTKDAKWMFFHWRATMMLVCREWYNLLTSTPTLWSLLYVTPTHPPHFISTLFSRSAHTPLDVHFVDSEDPAMAYSSKNLSLDAVRPVADAQNRIRTLVVPRHGGLVSAAFELLFRETTWPALECLRIFFARIHTPRDYVMDVLRLTPERFPKLKELSFTGIIIPIEPSAYPRLTKLALLGSGDEMPPFQDFVALLSTARSLTTLTVYKIDLGEVTSPETVALQPLLPFTLPNLRHLSLHSNRLDDFSTLLRFLRLDPSTDLRFHPMNWERIYDDEDEEEEEEDVQRSIVDVFFPPDDDAVDDADALPLPIARVLRSIELNVQGGCPMLFAWRAPIPGPDDPAFALSADTSRAQHSDYGLPEALCDLVTLFKGAPLARLKITGALTEVEAGTWGEVFRAFPDLKLLDLRGSGDASAVFAALAAPAAGEPEENGEPEASVAGRGFACPDLRRVTLGQVDDLKWPERSKQLFGAMVGALSARAQAQVPLESLVLHLSEPFPHVRGGWSAKLFLQKLRRVVEKAPTAVFPPPLTDAALLTLLHVFVMYALAFMTIALVANAAALSVPSRGLFARQLSIGTVPTQCSSQCTAISTTISSCSTIACLCTEAVNRGVASCLQCSLSSAADASLIAQGQQSLAAYEDSCAEAGAAVASITLSLSAATSAAASTGTSATSATGTTAAPTAATAAVSATAPKAPTAAASTATAAKTEGSSGPVNPFSTNGSGRGARGSSAAVVAAAAAALIALVL